MKDTIYLVCDNFGVQKMSKKVPKLKSGQAAVKVLVGIDNRVFMPPPMAEVKLDVEIPQTAIDRRTVTVVQQEVIEG